MQEIVYNRIAEASDLIVLFCVIITSLGLVIKMLWNRHIKECDSDKKAIKAKDKEIARLNTVNSETLQDNIAAMTKMLVVLDEFRSDINQIKDGNPKTK
jgi:cell division protein FtsL